MNLKLLNIIALFFFLFTFGCNRSYEKPKIISDKALSFFLSNPENKEYFVFKNENQDTVAFHYPFSTKRIYFKTTDGQHEMSYGRDPVVYREIVSQHSSIYRYAYKGRIDFEIRIKDENETGDNFEVFCIDFLFENQNIEFSIIADDYDYYKWKDTWLGLNYIYHETIALKNKIFYDIFSSSNYSNSTLYYNQQLGIIAFKIDSMLWINSTYL